jgi:hypothetical protein
MGAQRKSTAEDLPPRHRDEVNRLWGWRGAPYGGVLRERCLFAICGAKAIPRAGEFGVHSKVQANRAEKHLHLERVRP